MRKRINKQILDKMVLLIQDGASSEEIAAKLDKEGLSTPNGSRWNKENVAYYKSTYKLTKRAYRAVGIPENKSKPRSSINEKIQFILGLNLSKETMIKVLSEVI